MFGIVKSRELPSTPVSITRGQYITILRDSYATPLIRDCSNPPVFMGIRIQQWTADYPKRFVPGIYGGIGLDCV
ncbi:unnamed protein product [Allacma fusca]|uniref:Uncharacterized protein n=1 Tax=Allacma fusca TaxID=39272 RepID=A0A8J2NWB6_9HEXA|nr:unnamed protein product [Allacma fusca]